MADKSNGLVGIPSLWTAHGYTAALSSGRNVGGKGLRRSRARLAAYGPRSRAHRQRSRAPLPGPDTDAVGLYALRSSLANR